jgi:hypothetical protein
MLRQSKANKGATPSEQQVPEKHPIQWRHDSEDWASLPLQDLDFAFPDGLAKSHLSIPVVIIVIVVVIIVVVIIVIVVIILMEGESLKDDDSPAVNRGTIGARRRHGVLQPSDQHEAGESVAPFSRNQCAIGHAIGICIHELESLDLSVVGIGEVYPGVEGQRCANQNTVSPLPAYDLQLVSSAIED